MMMKTLQLLNQRPYQNRVWGKREKFSSLCRTDGATYVPSFLSFRLPVYVSVFLSVSHLVRGSMLSERPILQYRRCLAQRCDYSNVAIKVTNPAACCDLVLAFGSIRFTSTSALDAKSSSRTRPTPRISSSTLATFEVLFSVFLSESQTSTIRATPAVCGTFSVSTSFQTGSIVPEITLVATSCAERSSHAH